MAARRKKSATAPAGAPSPPDPATGVNDRRALLRAIGIVAAFGILIPLAYPTPDVWPLSYVALAGLAWQLRGARTPRRGLLYGFAFATAANLAGYYWITALLMDFGQIPFVAAFPLYVLLAAYQGLVYGLWGWGVVWLRERAGLPLWLAGPPLLVALEFTVPLLFPWALGESQWLNRPIAQLADLFSVFGISYLVALVNLAGEEAVWRTRLAPPADRRPFPAKLVGVAAGLYAAALGYGIWRTHEVDLRTAAAPKLKIAMVQPNIGIFDKHDEATGLSRVDLLHLLSAEADRAGADLAVWPEAAFPAPIAASWGVLPPSVRPHEGFSTPLAFGAIRYGAVNPATGRRASTNSLMLAGPDGILQGTYDKNFLVWFSEKIPWSEHFPWINKALPYSSDFTRGTSVPLWPFRGFLLAPNICFEDTLPRWTSHLTGAPHLIVNSTEDAWFGNTTEPWFHIAFATFRAIESHTSMVRSVNTGPSAVIDPVGRITAVTGIYTREVLVRDVPMVRTETVYQKIGDLFAYLCMAAVAAMGGYGVWRKRRDGGTRA